MEKKKKTLIQLRIESGKNQKEVAEFLGYKQSHYSHLETGKRELKAVDLQKLAEFYKISSDEINVRGL